MDTYEVAAPEVLAEDFGGEIVAINLESGRYYSLRGLAYAIWGDIGAGHPATAIRAGIASVDAGLGAETDAFIARLVQEKLIRTRSTNGAPAAALASVTVAQSGARKPLLESFDDMADLIKADPIHEVDEEFGWPIKKE